MTPLGPDGLAPLAAGAAAVGAALLAARALHPWIARMTHADFRIAIECGAAAQFAGASAAHLAAFDELAGQVTQDADKDGDADARDLGLSVAELAGRLGKRRSAWSYVYLPTDAEVPRAASLLIDRIDRGALDSLYLDPEAEVRAAGATGRRRMAELCERLADARPRCERIYNGMIAILDDAIGRACHAAAPMIYPLGSDGRPVAPDRQPALIARIYRERVAACRDHGLAIVRPTVFPAGHTHGGPSAALLAELTRETKTHGATFFQAGGHVSQFPYPALAAALRGAR